MGKISAQPHTIVKQIYFPNGNVLFCRCFLYPRTKCIVQYGAVRKFYRSIFSSLVIQIDTTEIPLLKYSWEGEYAPRFQSQQTSWFPNCRTLKSCRRTQIQASTIWELQQTSSSVSPPWLEHGRQNLKKRQECCYYVYYDLTVVIWI